MYELCTLKVDNNNYIHIIYYYMCEVREGSLRYIGICEDHKPRRL